MNRLRIFLSSPKGFISLFFILVVVNNEYVSQVLKQYFFLPLTSLFLSLLITPAVIEISKTLKIVDKPDERRKVHKVEISLLGGIGVALSFSGAIALSDITVPSKYVVLIACSLLILLVGLLDDIVKVSAKTRLLAQFFIALWVIREGISLEFFPINTLWGRSINNLMTIIWIIGFTNAYNFIDGLDGLAAGIGIIILSFTLCISYLNGVTEVMLVILPLCGALFGFLVFNFYPAIVFLGDAGAQFCGFLISVITADAGWAKVGEPVKALVGPGLVMWILIFDITQITILRIKHKKVKNFQEWIAFTGKDHTHHRLMALGHSQKNTVLLLYAITFISSLVALLINNLPQKVHIFVIAVSVIISVILLKFLDRTTSEKCFL